MLDDPTDQTQTFRVEDTEARSLAKRILVGVPALDEAAGIEACLASLMTGPPALSDVEIVVADGGSRDGTREIVRMLAERWPNLSSIPNEGRDQGAAINAVVRHGSPERDLLVRCDAHAIYPAGYVIDVARRMLEKGADALTVPMDAVPRADASAFERANALAVDSPLGSGGSAHRGGTRSMWVDHGHHAGMLRERFAALGGYDRSMVPNEDAEFDTRLREAGGRIWLESDLRIAYHPRASAGALWRQYHAYGRARARHIRKHKARPRVRQMLPPLLVLGLALSLVAAPLLPAALLLPLGYVAILLVCAVTTAVRRRTAWALWTGPAWGIMHLAWGTGFWRDFLLPSRTRSP